MPKIHVQLQLDKADFVFAPGDDLAVEIAGVDAARRDWADAECSDADPGVTVGQAETIRDLDDGGLTIQISDDGELSIVEY